MRVLDHFVPREVEMLKLELLLIAPRHAADRRKVAVVHGLGGIGKTELALEFARKHKEKFSGIFWLNGSTEASLKQSFVVMMKTLPQDELTVEITAVSRSATVDANMAVRECLHWLSLLSNHNWLMIIDNVDHDYRDRGDAQAYDLEKYFPQADHGSILVTSRLPGLERLGIGVEIGVIESAQAIAILESNAGKAITGEKNLYLVCIDVSAYSYRTDAAAISDLFHRLPLALAIVGSYLRVTNVSTSIFAKEYNQTLGRLIKKQDQLSKNKYGDHSLLTAWTMAYEQMQSQSEAAVSLLKLWGFFDSGELWYELVAPSIDLVGDMEVPASLYELAKNELQFDEAARILCRYSLAHTLADSGAYSMHAIMHQLCGRFTESHERLQLCCLAAGLVAKCVPSKGDADYWEKRKRLLAHGVSVIKDMNELAHDEETLKTSIQPWVYHNLGYLLEDEDQQNALKLYEQALEGYEKEFGPESTEALDTVNNLGILYENLHQYEKAEKMYRQALQGKEKVYGEEHTSTLKTVNNLGLLHKDLGNYEEAGTLLKRALEGKEKAYDAEHTSTLNTVNNLGLLYKDLGNHREAEKMYVRALRGYTKALGEDHSLTLDTVNNLGLLYRDVGNYKESEEMLERALDGKKKVWGEEHMSTLDTINNLGFLYKVLGEYKKAEDMYALALKGYTQKLRKDHSLTLGVAENLGNLYKDLGRLEEARLHQQRVLQGREHALLSNITRDDANLDIRDTSDLVSLLSVDVPPSLTSGSTLSDMSGIVKSAAQQFVEILIDDVTLQTLFPVAIEKAGILRFKRNFFRLLTRYAVELRTEASSTIQLEAARLVRSRANYMVHLIAESLQHEETPSLPRIPVSELDRELDLERFLQQQVSQTKQEYKSTILDMESRLSILDAEGYTDNNEEPDEPDEPEQPNLTNLDGVKRFMVESGAYKRLIQSFRSFVLPSEESVTTTPYRLHWICVGPLLEQEPQLFTDLSKRAVVIDIMTISSKLFQAPLPSSLLFCEQMVFDLSSRYVHPTAGTSSCITSISCFITRWYVSST
jgi:tetratricopeptide (TPR) repeat protein